MNCLTDLTALGPALPDNVTENEPPPAVVSVKSPPTCSHDGSAFALLSVNESTERTLPMNGHIIRTLATGAIVVAVAAEMHAQNPLDVQLQIHTEDMIDKLATWWCPRRRVHRLA